LTTTAKVSQESIDPQDKQPLRLLQHLLTQVAELHSERYGEFLSQHASAKIEKWLSGFIREETWNACKRSVCTLERCVRRDFEVCLLYILTWKVFLQLEEIGRMTDLEYTCTSFGVDKIIKGTTFTLVKVLTQLRN